MVLKLGLGRALFRRHVSVPEFHQDEPKAAQALL